MGLTKPRAYQIFDIDYKQSVRVVTVSNVTLSGGAPSQVDGVSLSLNDRVLVTAQSTGSQNGLYYVTTVGTGSNGTWARSVDGNETGEIDAGMVVMVTEGLVYADTQWKLITNDPITIGVTTLTFTQNYSANSITAGTSNVSVTSNSNVSIAAGGSNVVVFTVGGPHQFTGNLNPTSNVTYSLGNATNRWKDIYLANNSIYLGNVTLSADANQLLVNSANVVTATANGTITTSGNITGSYFIGNGSTLSSLTGSNVTGTVANATYATSAGSATTATSATTAGTVTTAAQPNITSVGTLSSLSVTGNVTGGNISTAGQLISSVVTGTAPMVITSTTKVTNLNVEQVDGYHADTANTVSTIAVRDASANIVANYYTGVGINVTGNITGGNITTAGNLSASTATANTNTTQVATTAFVIGQAGVATPGAVGSATVGTSTRYAREDHTHAGVTSLANGGGITASVSSGAVTLGSTATSANTASAIVARDASGNFSAGTITATLTGAATSATTAGTVTTAAQPNITSVGTLSSLTVSGNITAGNLTGATLVSATNLTGTLTTAAQPNITSVGTLSSLTVSSTGSFTGNITGGNLITAGLLSVNSGNVTSTVIVNAGANGVGNIGSATGYFNTAHVKATSAQYADLAEMYVADEYYTPGHVVVFGGEKEITLSTKSHDTAVAGIISTNPSYLMNATQEGEFVLAVALTGRVPCLVQGPVSKGDVLVTGTNPGTAQRIGINWQPGCTVGKAMEDISDSVVKVIEVAVGRL